MKNSISLTAITLLLAASSLSAATHYVSLESTNPTPPYTNWDTAATNIQDAVDVAAGGDLVLVTNGVYPGGVDVEAPVTLLSVNGPQVTLIDGGGTNQCISLTDGASLTGFMVTNGASGVGCTSTNVFLTNCVITGNFGRGAGGGTLYNCALSNNVAVGYWSWGGYHLAEGGGAYGCTLYNCTLTGNSADIGGAASGSTLYDCVLTRNSARTGGGASGSTLYNCTLSGNSATVGGGASADEDGVPSTLYNCIVYFNTAEWGAANYDSCALNYCCTTPLPTNGVGNISVDPQLASASHLSADSPCIGAGSAAYASGTDIDGQPWDNPPSIGCDEYHAGAVTGPLTVSLIANYTAVVVGFPAQLTALIGGCPTWSVWEFGDGDLAANKPYTMHSWTQPGDYAVTLWAFNESNPGGVRATLIVHVVVQPVLYVAAESTNPQPPYTNWATAATTIQAAVGVATVPGALVLVSNGVYTGGLAITNLLALRSVNGPQFTIVDGGGTNRCISLLDGASLTGFTLTNGWDTSNNGAAGVSCGSTNAFLTNCVIAGNMSTSSYGGTLYNCTLAGNDAGAVSSTLYNCILTGNISDGATSCTLYNCTLAGNIEGAAYCALYNCILTGNGDGAFECTVYNSALIGNSGNGAEWWSTLYNCTLTGNSGGVATDCMLYNCISYFNTASGGANYDSSCTLNYCCTTPLPTNGVGNIVADPHFVDTNGCRNLRLQSSSPCINAGNNAYVTTSADLDGRPRVVGGRVDMGAYEFQPGAPGAFIAWLQQYGLPTDGSADYGDPDHDDMNNWQEWVCGTCPTNASSALRLLSAMPTSTPSGGVLVTWQSVPGVSYFLESSTNLAASFTLVATNIPGEPGTTSYAETNAAGAAPFFYRVGVTPP